MSANLGAALQINCAWPFLSFISFHETSRSIYMILSAFLKQAGAST
jgi:hypothetical protein